jgi:hypothetical protein
MKTPNQDSSLNISKVINGSKAQLVHCADGFNNITWQRFITTGTAGTTNTVIRVTNIDNTTCDITLPTTYASGSNTFYEFNLPLNYKSISLITDSLDPGA